MNIDAVIRAFNRLEYAPLFKAIQGARRRRRWKVIYRRGLFLAMATASQDTATEYRSAYGYSHKGSEAGE